MVIVRLSVHSTTKVIDLLYDLISPFLRLFFDFTASGISFRLGITVPVRVVPNFVSSVARMGLV